VEVFVDLGGHCSRKVDTARYRWNRRGHGRDVCEGCADDGRVKDFSEKCLSCCVGIEKEAGNQEKWRVSRCNGYFCVSPREGIRAKTGRGIPERRRVRERVGRVVESRGIAILFYVLSRNPVP
jgi:hypothetical protein